MKLNSYLALVYERAISFQTFTKTKYVEHKNKRLPVRRRGGPYLGNFEQGKKKRHIDRFFAHRGSDDTNDVVLTVLKPEWI